MFDGYWNAFALLVHKFVGPGSVDQVMLGNKSRTSFLGRRRMKALFGQKGGNISDLTKTDTPSCVYFVFPAKSIGVYLLQRIFGEKRVWQ
jgi:hypothetical protein